MAPRRPTPADIALSVPEVVEPDAGSIEADSKNKARANADAQVAGREGPPRSFFECIFGKGQDAKLFVSLVLAILGLAGLAIFYVYARTDGHAHMALGAFIAVVSGAGSFIAGRNR